MDDSWEADIGPRIKEARERAGMTQQAVAEAIDRTKASISNWERGERTPSVDEVRRVAEATNQDVRWLLHGDSYQDPLNRIEDSLAEMKTLLERATRPTLTDELRRTAVEPVAAPTAQGEQPPQPEARPPDQAGDGGQ